LINCVCLPKHKVKSWIRSFIYAAIALYSVTLIVPTVYFAQNWKIFFGIVTALFVINKLIKTIVTMIFIPLNIITFNIINFALVSALFFVIPRLISVISIAPYDFPGISAYGYSLDPMSFSAIGTVLVAAGLYTIIFWFLKWTAK